MTTFIDNLGITASPKIGVVALNVPNSPAVDIPLDCGWMIVVATPTANNANLNLPAGANVGDVFEVYVQDSAFSGFTVHTPSGETLNGGSGQVTMGLGRSFRKITSTVWGVLGPTS